MNAAEELLAITTEIELRSARYQLKKWLPEIDQWDAKKDDYWYSLDKYSKVKEFIIAGLNFTIRLFDGANQSGKTSGAAYEVVHHITGLYPDHWPGKKLKGPSKWWIAGETNNDVREIMQERLIGPVDARGTGLIPFICLDTDSMTTTLKTDTFISTVRVRHFDENGQFDGYSVLTFKSYEAGRTSFQGLPRNIWLDEEPPLDILSECMARLTSDDELMMIITFTPLKGWSPMLQNFLPNGWQNSGPVYSGGKLTNKYLVVQTVYDVPHISQKKIDEMETNYHPHVRDARLRGIPSLGSGAIYPIPKPEWIIPDHQIPPHWKRFFGMDVGWNWTAVVWFAINPDNGVRVAYDAYLMAQTEPIGHAEAIRSRGMWIPGVIDSAANGRGQDGGESLINQYRNLGLEVSNANKSVEAGIYAVWSGMKSGTIKVFSSLSTLINNIENYQRDEKGKIVKRNDHDVDAFRYGIMSGADVAVNQQTQGGRTGVGKTVVSARYRNLY